MNTVTLKLTAAIVVAGQVLRPGSLVEVTESEAKDLLRRGKAVVATAADGVEVDAASDAGDATLNPEIQAANAALAPEGEDAPATEPKPANRRRR